MPIRVTENAAVKLALNGKRESTGPLKNSWRKNNNTSGIKHTVTDTTFTKGGSSGKLGRLSIDVQNILGDQTQKIYSGQWRVLLDDDGGLYLQNYQEDKSSREFKPTVYALVLKQNNTGFNNLKALARSLGLLQDSTGKIVNPSTYATNYGYKGQHPVSNTSVTTNFSAGRNTTVSGANLPTGQGLGLAGASVPASSALGKGPTNGTWVEKMSKSKGKPYWVSSNNSSKTTWFRPSGNARVVSSTSGGRKTRKASGSRGSKRTRRH